MKKVILDTNFIMFPFLQNIDIFDEIDRIMMEPYQIFIVDKTLDELEGLKGKGKMRYRKAAEMAFKLLELKKVKVISTGKQKSLYMNVDSKDTIVDDILLDISDGDTIVATQDKDLKRRLSDKGIKLIILKSKNHLGFR